MAMTARIGSGGSTVDRWRVYLGTGSQHGSEGIYLAELDLTSGRVSEPTLATEAERPAFLAVHPNGQWMYSVGAEQQADGQRVGVVYAFAIDARTGRLTHLNRQPAGGDGPCHLVVDPQGRAVLVANYSSGSVAVLPIEGDGKLAPVSCVVQHTGSSVHERRQQGPHAHAVQVHPDGRFAFAADLGADRLLAYRYDSEAGQLTPLDAGSLSTKPGAGPRHFAFHPTLDRLYLINELDSTVLTLRFDAEAGRLEQLQNITSLPADFTEVNYPSEVAVHPSGRFLYGANRGHDSLAVFRIDETGQLEPAGHVAIEGAWPRHFAIDPTGQFLLAALEKSDSVSVFRIDQETGLPSFTGQHIPLGSPMMVLYRPLPDAE